MPPANKKGPRISFRDGGPGTQRLPTRRVMSGGLAGSREIPNSRATGSPRFRGRRARFFLLGLVEYVENFGVPVRRCHFDHVVATVFVRLAALIFLCDGVGTDGIARSRSTAARVRLGAICLNNSGHFPQKTFGKRVMISLSDAQLDLVLSRASDLRNCVRGFCAIAQACSNLKVQVQVTGFILARS